MSEPSDDYAKAKWGAMNARLIDWIDAVGAIVVGTTMMTFGRLKTQGTLRRRMIICGVGVLAAGVVLILFLLTGNQGGSHP